MGGMVVDFEIPTIPLSVCMTFCLFVMGGAFLNVGCTWGFVLILIGFLFHVLTLTLIIDTIDDEVYEC